eukprot:gene13228-biopygen3943
MGEVWGRYRRAGTAPGRGGDPMNKGKSMEEIWKKYGKVWNKCRKSIEKYGEVWKSIEAYEKSMEWRRAQFPEVQCSVGKERSGTFGGHSSPAVGRAAAAPAAAPPFGPTRGPPRAHVYRPDITAQDHPRAGMHAVGHMHSCRCGGGGGGGGLVVDVGTAANRGTTAKWSRIQPVCPGGAAFPHVPGGVRRMHEGEWVGRRSPDRGAHTEAAAKVARCLRRMRGEWGARRGWK